MSSWVIGHDKEKGEKEEEMAGTARGNIVLNLTTRAKMLAGFGLVSLIMVVTATFGVLTLQRLSVTSQAVYADYTVPLADFAELGTAITTYHEILIGMTNMTTQEDFLSEVKRLPPHQEKVNRVLTDYATTVHRISRAGRDETKDFVILRQVVEQYFKEAEGGLSALADSFGNSLTAIQSENLRELGILALRVNLQQPFDQVIARHREQVLDLHDVAKDLNDDAQTVISDGVTGLMVGGFVAVAIGFGIGYWIAGFFSKTFGHIEHVAQLAASGNYQSRAKITTKEEFGQMATAFNTMLDRIIASLEAAEAERDEMEKRLMVLLDLVADVGKGDLTKRGEVTADVFGNLADGFNLMIQRFGQLTKQVREAAERVNKSAMTLRENANQMVDTAKQQAEESAKTLSVVDQLTSSMHEVAVTASASSESAKQVLEATEQGRAAAQETVKDMQNIRLTVQRMSKQVKGLGDRSLEISAILLTIQNFANQTNLLALNAAIETAGAGEVGVRFAVVADQVRKLTESLTQATREIADLVKVIHKETQETVASMEYETQTVEAGSAAALKTDEVFSDISEIAQRSAELAQVTASAAVNQTASTDKMGRSLKDLAGGAVAAQQATDSVRATVEDMAKLAEGLTCSVAQFKWV